MILETLMICASLTVVDGDTVKCHNPGVANQNLRLLGGGIVGKIGIDTPEKGNRARCETERDLADKATERTAMLLDEGVVKIEVKGVDVFNRPLVNIYLADGREIGHTLFVEGYARTWVKGRHNDWCNLSP